MTVRVAVAGAGGYAGAELLRPLDAHPEVEIFARPVHAVCQDLARRLVADAEGASKEADLPDRRITDTAGLRSGDAAAGMWTNDLTAEYAHENSAYSS